MARLVRRLFLGDGGDETVLRLLQEYQGQGTRADKSNPDFPLGFTPAVETTAVENDQLDEVSPINQQNERERWRTTSGGENYDEKSENVADSFRCSQPNNFVGFLILNRLEEAIQFDKALGIDMDGCADDIEKLINGIGAKGFK
ncbi:hypothetical protein Tco_0523317 [Tanacetum coccineum]